MIRLTDLCLSFTERPLFEALSWHIATARRIGLVGDNGAGKTTLLRVMTGRIQPDAGTVRITRRVRLGMLEQDFTYSSSRPLIEVTMEGAGDLSSLQDEISRLHDEVARGTVDSPEHAAAMRRLGHLQEEFEERDGFRLEANARRILAGLGFAGDEMDRPLDSFSGGWQMRGAMARLLLARPDLLLLDEPTNHLDIETTEWLERFLRRYNGSVVIVSHDRYFLDRTVGEIAELVGGRLHFYTGNYTAFREQKDREHERRLAEFNRQHKRIEEIERFVERFRYKATKAKQVQSRLKMLEKMPRIDVSREAGGIHFLFPSCSRSGDIALELQQLSKSYGSKAVFGNIDLTLMRGEKVALVGPNGAGKSTLARIITGKEIPTRGTCRLGHKVCLGAYTQEAEARMDPEAGVLDELARDAQSVSERRLRNLLGCFLFSAEDVHKPVGVLSGGERSRLAVAKLLLTRANFLVLDEPTNHLDLKAKNVLQQALIAFEGTLIVVSHDRYFLDRVVSRVLEMHDGRLRDFAGNYTAYLERKEAEQEQANAAALQRRRRDRTNPGTTAPRGRKQRKRATEEKIRRGRILREKEARVTRLEDEIVTLEKEQAVIEEQMACRETLGDPARLAELGREHARLRRRLEELGTEWEAALLAVDETRKHLDEEQN